VADVAWNTEETRRRIQEAATHEFAAHGLHGTTVERIAARAGVNKERIYNYFGDKQQLFVVVLGVELAKVAEAVPMRVARVEDVGDYVGRTFDYHVTHPELSRLLHWEGLADTGAVPDELTRTGHYREKVAVIAEAQRSGVLDDALVPGDVVYFLIAMAAWWGVVPQLARMLTASDAGEDELARRRAAVVVAAERLVRPVR
jgi:AcrR family transcriptional regulator